MTKEQILTAIDQLKAEGYSEEEIIGAFYKMFSDEKITLQEFEDLVNLIGYELTEKFKNMSPEDQRTKFYED